jgi:D-glycero-D-manno-heptose 1,7-bisphosphate phosphatase
MRVLVHARSFDPRDARLACAVIGLEQRGHEVRWRGPPPVAIAGATTIAAPGGPALARLGADVVVGGAHAPWRAALAARFAGARALVLALHRDVVARWSANDRASWDLLHAAGLVEESEADAMRANPMGLDPEDLGLWSSEPAPREPDVAHVDVEILERACERALARDRTRAPRAGVFVDRDGTLVREIGYLADPADLELLPRTAEALRRLRAAGFPIVVVSNQSGVGRGLFPLRRVYEAMARLRAMLREARAEPDAIYFCPHRPDAGCRCRKPGTLLLERAADDLGLSLARSIMIGDKLLDAETGRHAGGHGILVRTGYGRDEENRLGDVPERARPDVVCEDLGEAADWILGRVESAASG